MPLVSPEQIVAKSVNAYSRFLKSWILGEDAGFFPHRLRMKLSIDTQNPGRTIAANDTLIAKSKAHRGWGYTVHREQIRKRDFGTNLVPKSITIDTRDDLLRLSQKKEEFEATRHVVKRIRDSLPQLSDWLASHILSLYKISDSIEGLMQVAQYFIENPLPDCYIRQIPVPVDTKFVENHQSLLKQWLDILLPASAINVNESRFLHRFGLRDGQSHHALRLLDQDLIREFNLPFEELSLPLRSLAIVPVKNVTVFIVENNLNLVTLPQFERGIAIRGEGNAVSRLESLAWLNENRILYWGDIDVDGFLILSRLRNLFPQTQSVMMDQKTLFNHETESVSGNGTAPTMPTNFTESEALTFGYCLQNNVRLEQEKIRQTFVEQTLVQIASETI